MQEKPLRIHLNNTCGEFVLQPGPKLFLKLAAEPTIITIFDKIKKEIKKMEHPTKSIYVNLDKMGNKKKVILNFPIYMQDVVIHYKSIRKKNNKKNKTHTIHKHI